MSEEENKTPETQGTAPAHKPPLCERYPGCIFFNDKMANMPDTAEATKDQFCRGNFPTCARYILQSIWKIKAPEDMFPYQLARAQAILDATVTDQKAITPSSEELAAANRTIKLLVNALGHGFMMFDKEGLCQPILSKACATLLEIQPVGKHIAEVLHLDAKQTETMATALKLVFNQTHAMSFDEIMRFAPKIYKHSSGSIIRLVYKPDRFPSGALNRIIVIATDITEQVHEQESAEERKALFESLEHIFHDRAFFGSYVRRMNETLAALEGKGQPMTRDALRREVHTLKGDAGIFKLSKLATKLHELETAMDLCASAAQNTLPSPSDPCFAPIAEKRGEIAREIAEVSNYLKELLGIDITKIEGERSFDKKILYAFAETLAQKGQMELRQEYLRTVCAESLRAYLKRFDTVLSDLAMRFNKQIKPIVFENEDIPVILDLYRGLLDSFVHLFRNTIDHGIETPDKRQEEGKDEAAEVRLRMRLYEQAPGQTMLHLEIEDDGAGVIIEKLRQKLWKKLPNEKWDMRTDQEILDALLTQNISSRDTISLYSGRGVGMGAVYAQVKERGGDMKLSTKPHQGTLITIDVPYILDTPKT